MGNIYKALPNNVVHVSHIFFIFSLLFVFISFRRKYISRDSNRIMVGVDIGVYCHFE